MNIYRSFGSFLFTLVIYIGLPLLGWGLDNISGFFAFPQRTLYAVSIVGFGLLAGYASQRPGGLGNPGKGKQEKFVPRQRVVRMLVTGMLFIALVFVPFADRRNIGVSADHPVTRWIGFFLATLGMGVIFWSGLALGRLYSPEVTLQEGHRLITSGPYAYIRHPRYLGGIVQGIGLSLLFRSWIGLALTLVFLIIVSFRIKDEEALMSREFGREWEMYCKKSRLLVPFIY